MRYLRCTFHKADQSIWILKPRENTAEIFSMRPDGLVCGVLRPHSDYLRMVLGIRAFSKWIKILTYHEGITDRHWIRFHLQRMMKMTAFLPLKFSQTQPAIHCGSYSVPNIGLSHLNDCHYTDRYFSFALAGKLLTHYVLLDSVLTYILLPWHVDCWGCRRLMHYRAYWCLYRFPSVLQIPSQWLLAFLAPFSSKNAMTLYQSSN